VKELNVVDDDEGQRRAFLFQFVGPPAGGAADVQNGRGRGKIEEQGGRRDLAGHVRDGGPTFPRQEPFPNAPHVDSRLTAQETKTDFLLAHFEGEKHHRAFVFNGHMFGHVQTKSRFSHGGPARNDDQVRGLKAGGHFVPIGETRGNAGDRFAGFGQFLKRR
jgi:hypothetical protein